MSARSSWARDPSSGHGVSYRKDDGQQTIACGVN
jgi:hypothetical protein